MKRRKVLALFTTAVMTFTSVAPETALFALAEDDEVVADVEAEELPFDLKGMPEGYTLSAEQLEMKAAMKDHDVLGTFTELTEGVDYEADTVICLAETEEEAQAIAEAYNSELVHFELGVGRIKLSEKITMQQALSVAEDPAYLMPVIAPNYVNQLIDNAESEEEITFEELQEFISESAATTDVHTSSWEKYVQKGGLAKPDTYLQDPSSTYYQWMHDMIGTYDAWDASTGNAISVAVLDTGVLKDHPDLSGRVEQVPVNGIKVDTYTSSHGTHVAGIIGATAGNGVGVAGVAPNVKIYSYNVFTDEGAADADWMAALNSCAQKGIPIANMSLGGPVYNPLAQQVINNVTAAGVNVVVAMGNDYSNLKSYPAVYDNTISVSSVNPKGEKSVFSTYGKDADVCAPGTHIMSCYNPKSLDLEEEKKSSYIDSTGYYGIMSGTSMATPVVSGICALYMSKFGPQKTSAMLKVLQKNATKTSSKQIGKIVNVKNMFASSAKAKAKSDDNRVFSFDIEGADEGAYVVYTTDGTDPSLVDGQIFNGQKFDGAAEFDTSKSVVVVKSIVVTAAGEIGDIEMASFAVAGNIDNEVAAAKSAPIAVTGDYGRVVDNKAYIFTTNVPNTKYDDTVLTLTAPSSVKWSVDGKGAKVVEVATAEGTSTVIKGLKTGKATIVAEGPDKSKTKIKIEVIIPASSISITPDGSAGADYAGHIAIGKSVTAGLVLGNTYGNPSVKKVEWDYVVPASEALNTAAHNNKAVKISSKGKISINKKAWEKSGLGETTIVVMAKTTDGTGLTAVAEYKVWKPASKFKTVIINPNTGTYKEAKKIRVGRFTNNGDGVSYALVGVVTEKKIETKSDFLVTSSNPNFAGAKFFVAGTCSEGYMYVFQVFAGRKTSSGSAKITITLNDGSKKKASITLSH